MGQGAESAKPEGKAAHYFGAKLEKTKRYLLGELLSRRARHFLLMTATPHSGKDEDFQLFLGLLDADRFAGKFRRGIHADDVGDLMRRVVKEDLLTFDGKPLFPERVAQTVPYELTADEASLYELFNPVRARGDEPRRQAGRQAP